MAEGRPTTSAPAPPVEPSQPSLGDLVSSASADLSVLVRSEVALAKSEVRTEVKKAVAGGAGFAVAAVLALYALVLLSFAAVYGIVALGLDEGWSFLIVGGVYLLITTVAALLGVRAVKRIGPPERTVRTAKETVAALKNRSANGDGQG